MSMNRETAETLALDALAWLLADDGRAPAFLNATGADPAELGARLGDPAFLVGVLQVLLQDEGWVRAFCADTGRPPTAPMAALHALPGGAPVHWT